MGGDFIDQNESIVNEVPFATYLLGKGYISKDIVNNLLEESGSLQYMLGGYDDSYCIFTYGECEEGSNCKKYHLLAEYIFEVDALKKRLFNVLKGWWYDGSNKEDHDSEYGETKLELDENDFMATGGDFKGTFHDEWLWVLNHSIEDVNKIISEKRAKEEE
jgi:hypothetical protein